MRTATVSCVILLFALLAPEAAAQRAPEPAEVWRVTLPEQLRSRIYQAAILPGTTEVIVTSPEGLWRIDDAGEVAPLAWFERLDQREELGLSPVLNADASRVGVLKHDRHALAGFELFDRQGDAIATVPDTETFYYRIAPSGRSFVGIDAGGEHIPVKASRFVYHLFDQAGRRVADIESEAPRPFDSDYSADGALFVLSNRDGLSAYGASDGRLRWMVPVVARSFATADAVSGVIAATGEEDRRRIGVFRNGEQILDYRLESNSSNIAVSPNGRFVLAADGTTAYLLAPPSNQALWQIALPEAGYAIRSIAVSGAGLALIGAQHESGRSGMVLIADQGGRVVYRANLQLARSNAQIPAVQIGAGGESALLRSLEELILIDLR
jgi:hypothetical protein